MATYRDLAALDAAGLLADEVNQLLNAAVRISFTEHSCVAAKVRSRRTSPKA